MLTLLEMLAHQTASVVLVRVTATLTGTVLEDSSASRDKQERESQESISHNNSVKIDLFVLILIFQSELVHTSKVDALLVNNATLEKLDASSTRNA